MSSDHETVLSDELLRHCAERAPRYDTENSFFIEDFEELKAAGYLNGPIPKELGGGGLTLARSCAEQTRLAYHAPATALAINMHLYWVGVAADLWRWGDKSLEWLLSESVAGEVFAAGHSERGNDLPIFLSTATARKADGGYRFSGHKMFGSLTPVWTRFGIHALEADHADGPQIIHAFMPREAEGHTIKETWDVLGMRATRSDDTILDDVFVEDKYIARTVPAGQGDPFVLALFAWALLGFASIYCGVAQRAIDLVLPGINAKSSLGLGRSMAYHPEVQHAVAQMVLANESIGPLPRANLRRLDGRRRPRRGLAVQDRRHQVSCGRDLLEGRRHGDGRLRRHRHVPRYRAGTPVPRCPLRPLPSGQFESDPRNRGQDGTRHRPRRAAALGLRMM